MNNYPHPVIAREGWPFLGLAVALAAMATLFSAAWSIPFWIIALFSLQFFCDPARVIPQKANAVLSPADGRIVVVEKTQDPYVGREMLKISVFWGKSRACRVIQYCGAAQPCSIISKKRNMHGKF